MNINSGITNLKKQLNQTINQEVQLSAAEETTQLTTSEVNDVQKEEMDMSDLMNYIGLEIQRKGGQ